MLIVSWNVAGWTTTVNRIDRHYKPPSPANQAGTTTTTTQRRPKLHPAASIQHFFERHEADIVCLQEHKIQKQQLANRAEPCQASTIPGYESFWSCCVDENHKGLNGVVTYAPTGSVVAADASPLGSSDLDNQGRCIMTDHGSFCLFNVYAPNSGGHPLAFQLKFLQALRRAMQRQRERNKQVILVGDLNISHKARDIFWKDRCVHIQDILDEEEEQPQQPAESVVPRWKQDVKRHWLTIEKVLLTKTVVEAKTLNTVTNQSHDKYRLAVTLADGRRVHLGRHESMADHCGREYNFSSRTYCDEETDQVLPCRQANVVSVAVLTELLAKLVGVIWDESVQREIASTVASEPRLSPARAWLTSLLVQDGMVDSFRHLYPMAEGRFTCWHQFTNRRYENEGARIDYCLVDASLATKIQTGSGLRCGGGGNEEDPAFALGEQAALQAATANGRFEPASFGGEGIQTASQRTLDSQFGPGTFYTRVVMGMVCGYVFSQHFHDAYSAHGHDLYSSNLFRPHCRLHSLGRQ